MFYLNETISAVPGIFINEVRTIEKGKKGGNPLWQAYSSKVSNEQKVNLIKELFGFKSEEEISNELKKDYIDLNIIRLESKKIYIV